MNTSKKRYDSKHKLTRILLADYLVLKQVSQAAGISMAEALHRLIEHQAQLPLPMSRLPPVPVLSYASKTAVLAKAIEAIATNGNKPVAFRIKPRGVRRE